MPHANVVKGTIKVLPQDMRREGHLRCNSCALAAVLTEAHAGERSHNLRVRCFCCGMRIASGLWRILQREQDGSFRPVPSKAFIKQVLTP